MFYHHRKECFYALIGVCCSLLLPNLMLAGAIGSPSVEASGDTGDFIVSIYADEDVVLGQSFEAFAGVSEPTTSLVWEPASWLTCEEDCEQSVEVLPLESGYLSVTAYSETGCVATDSVYINVRRLRKVFIPTAFSPNHDGINDFFYIRGAQPNVQEIERLEIFDRWGRPLFKAYNFQPNSTYGGWDGSFQGEDLPTGTYIYLARIRFIDGEVIVFSDRVNLVR